MFEKVLFETLSREALNNRVDILNNTIESKLKSVNMYTNFGLVDVLDYHLDVDIPPRKIYTNQKFTAEILPFFEGLKGFSGYEKLKEELIQLECEGKHVEVHVFSNKLSLGIQFYCLEQLLSKESVLVLEKIEMYLKEFYVTEVFPLFKELADEIASNRKYFGRNKRNVAVINVAEHDAFVVISADDRYGIQHVVSDVSKKGLDFESLTLDDLKLMVDDEGRNVVDVLNYFSYGYFI